MKKFLLSLLVYLLSPANTVRAQATQEQNRVAFERLQTLINEQAADSIYAMLSDDFKKQFPPETFRGLLKNSIFPLGKINAARLLKYRDGASSYKVDFTNAMTEVMIASTVEGKIAGLNFRPYKDAASVPGKDYKVATTNAMLNAFDKSVDSIATSYINQKNTVGLAIGIWKDGKTVTYGYGETAKGNNKIPGEHTLFEIGSITKTFTGTLLAYYVNERKIKLADPIIKYLPDSIAVNSSLNGITVQMLANHTSGLPRLPANLSLATEAENLNPYKNYSREQLFSFLKSYSGDGKPGQQYDYSNLGTGLLGVILEHVSGKTFEQMVEKVICDPLDMEHTVQYLNKDVSKDMVAVYSEEGKEILMWDFDAMAAAGALRSTVSDMLRFAKANIEKGNNKLGRAMQLAQKITYEKADQKMGLSWHYLSAKNNIIIWHNGGTGGSRSFLAFDPKKKLAVVVLSNSEESVDEVGIQLIKLMLRS